jgi:hypothetical protein
VRGCTVEKKLEELVDSTASVSWLGWQGGIVVGATGFFGFWPGEE